MRIDIGETETDLRIQAKRCSEGLLAALTEHHGECPEPRKIIPIKTYEGADVADLRSQIQWLQGIVTSQRKLIERLCENDEFAIPRFSEVLAAVCAFYKISKVNITGQQRCSKYTLPRQIACYLGRELTGKSLPEIGRKLGNRDHTTVFHAVHKIEGMMGTSAVLRDDLDVLRIKIAAKVLEREALVERAA